MNGMSNGSALLENILHMADNDEVDFSDSSLPLNKDIKVVVDMVQSEEAYNQEKGYLGEETGGIDLANDDIIDEDVNLVEMFRNLMDVGSQIKNGIEFAIKRDQAKKAKKAEDENSSESEEELEDEEEDEENENQNNGDFLNVNEDDEDDEEDNEEDDNDAKAQSSKPAPTGRRSAKPKTELERLLVALHLHKKQKQNLIIKKALLLKFEEALFGNNNITMTVDLRQMGGDEKNGKLEEILQCKDLTNYLPKSLTDSGNSLEFAEKADLLETVTTAKSPPDILNRFRAKTPKKIAINLIKQQYNIRWNTKCGEYQPFDFFELPKQFAKGIVRKMHMQTVLYEHKADVQHLKERLAPSSELTKEAFSPKYVYVKKDPYRRDPDVADEDAPKRLRDEPKFSWQSWDLSTDECTERGFEFPEELKWINPKVKILIKKLTTPIADDFNTKNCENVMYLLVVNDTTSRLLQDQGNCSQIFIGAADNGLQSRFLEAQDSHSNRILELYEHYVAMQSFNPHPTALLVEMRMLLALARREPFALFALEVFDSPRTLGREVHDLVIKALYLANNEIWGPAVNMRFGLNVKEELKKRRRFLPDHFPGKNRRRKK